MLDYSNILVSPFITLILGVLFSLGFATPINAQPAQPETLPPWQNVTIYWEWVPGLVSGAITQCQTQKLDWWQVHSPPVMTGPYTYTFYRESYEPYVLPVGMGVASGMAFHYSWTVDLPTGGPYQISFTDANGLTGGSASAFSVVGGTAACTPVNLTTSKLQLSFVGDLTQCSQTNITVTGGTPPYMFSTLEAGNEPKIVSYTTGYFEYILDMRSGSIVNFAVNDSTGLGAVGQQFKVGFSGDVSCLALAPTLVPLSPALTSLYQGLTGFPTPSAPAATSITPETPSHGKSVNVAAVVGGAVGGLGLVLLVVIFGALRLMKKWRNAPRDVDLFDSNEPVSQPAIGNSMFPPRPYSYMPLSLEADAIPSAKMEVNGELGGHGAMREQETTQQHTPRSGSTKYESDPLSEMSPPYSEDSRLCAGTSSSHATYYNNRLSGATFTSDSKSNGERSSRLSPDQDALSSPTSGRSGRSLPPLPPGAASPDHSLAAIQRFGMSRTPELDGLGLQQFDFLQNVSHSPPPGYS
ncbi:hypothetical protein FRB98_008197 [Tulasnella sp. 332]|nr:hypothetical protein FRB98_008197 [Tulasnella sp. 332]